MGDKGEKDKGKREQQKKAQLNPKENRKEEINAQCSSVNWFIANYWGNPLEQLFEK